VSDSADRQFPALNLTVSDSADRQFPALNLTVSDSADRQFQAVPALNLTVSDSADRQFQAVPALNFMSDSADRQSQAVPFVFTCRNVYSDSCWHQLITYIAVLWLVSRVVSMLDSGAEEPGFKSQSRRFRVTVLGKLFIPIVPLFT